MITVAICIGLGSAAAVWALRQIFTWPKKAKNYVWLYVTMLVFNNVGASYYFSWKYSHVVWLTLIGANGVAFLVHAILDVLASRKDLDTAEAINLMKRR